MAECENSGHMQIKIDCPDCVNGATKVLTTKNIRTFPNRILVKEDGTGRVKEYVTFSSL